MCGLSLGSEGTWHIYRPDKDLERRSPATNGTLSSNEKAKDIPLVV